MTRVKRQPKVGIFWVYHGELLSARTGLDEGIHMADSIDSPHHHDGYWSRLQGQHTELRYVRYEEVPRGRVVFVKKSKRFSVYMDKRLHRPRFKRLILECFDLPKSRTRFLTDPHYTTDPAELDRLFGDA